MIPLLLRKEMLHNAHGGHVGLEASLHRLRSNVLAWNGCRREGSNQTM